MMKSLAVVSCLLLTGVIVTACGQAGGPGGHSKSATTQASPSKLILKEDIFSVYVSPRNVNIWLPAGYEESGERYPVIYMHDGQNLFEGGKSYTGDEWQVDETMQRLIDEGRIRPAIIVGIWNTDTRWRDYAPQKVIESLPAGLRNPDGGDEVELYGDAYLKYIVEELKPLVDETYRTKPEVKDTFISGASMGGLISLYAVGEYPDVFGGAAGLSIHWPIADPRDPRALEVVPAMQSWIASSGLDTTRHSVWLDHGTLGLDSTYGPYSEAMKSWFADNGYAVDMRIYEGTDHNEQSWAARLHEPLIFLLGR